MQLREVGGGWRMHTHPAYASHIEKLLLSSRRARLTRAAVETLAIIAYMQPITRGQVANLRGVQSENMVKVLEEQGLVAEAGKERSPGGPVLYVTTEKFLERFGLNSLEELTPLEDFEPDRETVERIAHSLSGQPAEGGGESDQAEEEDVETDSDSSGLYAVKDTFGETGMAPPCAAVDPSGAPAEVKIGREEGGEEETVAIMPRGRTALPAGWRIEGRGSGCLCLKASGCRKHWPRRGWARADAARRSSRPEGWR